MKSVKDYSIYCMVIIGFDKWLNQNFPEISSKMQRNSVQCSTLYIDAFQFYFNALYKSSDSKEFIGKYLRSIKNVILSINPSDTIFVFLDGPSPAIKFQKLRERWFSKCHIDDFEIDSSEYVLEEIEDDEESGHEALEGYLKKIINYDNVSAKSIIYSSLTVPGEAKYKYFDYFREMKSRPDFVPSRKHILLSNTNEMFFLALLFIDEQFYISKSNHIIYDVDQLRNLILYHMATDEPFPGLYKKSCIDEDSLEKRKREYQDVVSKMSNELKQQIINDVVALSIVVSSENFQPFPEIKRMGTSAFTYSKLLDSYRKLNQPYINSQIMLNQDDTKEFNPLIVNGVFNLSSFRKIMNLFLGTYFNKQNHPDKDKQEDLPLNENENTTEIENNEKVEHSNEVVDDEDDVANYSEQAQQLFRVFNFTWQLYTNRCLSWSFQYQFKKSPPLKTALQLMHEEGLDVFDTEGSKDVTEPLFKNFIIYPVEVVDIPYSLYKLKIPPSPISRFWPLGVTDPADIPILDVNEVKLLYKEAKKEMNGDRPEKNVFGKTYEIARKQNNQQRKVRSRQGFNKRSRFPVGKKVKY